MKSSNTLFIFAGEPSGDKHGAQVLKALKEKQPNLSCVGVGGPALKAEGLQVLIPMEQFCVMGFTDVIKALPRLCRHFYTIRNYILRHSPEAVLLVDYPGFNLRLAKALRQKGFTGKIIQYVAPMVWAWGEKRIATMERCLDQLLVIYPFETDFFAKSSLPTAYVGNPVSESLNSYVNTANWKQEVGLPLDQPPLSLFPGSRRGEIERNLSIQLEAARLLQAIEPNLPIAVSLSAPEHLTLINSYLEKSGLTPGSWSLVPSQFSHELMQESRAAIAKSGTVTLELALHGCPTVVTYVLTRLNKFLARHWMKLSLDYFCIVNVLAKKEIFPELIAEPPTPQKIVQKMQQMLNHPKECREGCDAIRRALSEKQASLEAAWHVERMCSR